MPDYRHLATDKYVCRKCKKKMMYPNEEKKRLNGYKCFVCDTINHPVKSKALQLLHKQRIIPRSVTIIDFRAVQQ